MLLPCRCTAWLASAAPRNYLPFPLDRTSLCARWPRVLARFARRMGVIVRILTSRRLRCRAWQLPADRSLMALSAHQFLFKWQVLNFFGMFMILAGHEHYSIGARSLQRVQSSFWARCCSQTALPACILVSPSALSLCPHLHCTHGGLLWYADVFVAFYISSR